MKITDLLKKESVLLEGHATDKKDALHTLVGLMAKQGNVADVETYEACVLKREEEGSTGVGEALPFLMPRRVLSHVLVLPLCAALMAWNLIPSTDSQQNSFSSLPHRTVRTTSIWTY